MPHKTNLMWYLNWTLGKEIVKINQEYSTSLHKYITHVLCTENTRDLPDVATRYSKMLPVADGI